MPKPNNYTAQPRSLRFIPAAAPTKRNAFARPCPKCGANPYSSCTTRRGLVVTGMKDGEDGSYTVKLKTFHKERRRPQEPQEPQP